MRKLFYLLAFMLLATISNVANAQYPRSSYQIRGTVLLKWNGPETEIDMSSDDRLSTVTEIGVQAFWGNKTVRNIVFPSTLRSLNVASLGNSKLQELVVPEGVTRIESLVTYGCYELRTIDIPSTITNLSSGAFFLYYSTSIEKVVCRVASPPTNLYKAFLERDTNSGIDKSTLDLSNITLYVPKASLKAYRDRNATESIKFKAVKAIEDDDSGTDPMPEPEQKISIKFSVDPLESASFEITHNGENYNNNEFSITTSKEESINVVSKAKDGYKFEKYVINNKDFNSNGSASFTLNLSEYKDFDNITVVAKYIKEKPVEKKLNVYFNVSEGKGSLKYTVKDSDPVQSSEGKSMTENIGVSKTLVVEATPDAGFDFSKFVVNGKQIEDSKIMMNGSTAKIEIPLSDYSSMSELRILASFTQKVEKIKVMFEAKDGGMIAYEHNGKSSDFKMSDSQTFNVTETITIKAKSNQDYKFDKFVIDGVEMDLRGATSVTLPLQGYKGKSEIKVIALFSKTTSIDVVDTTTKVFAHNGYVKIQSESPANVQIFSVDGQKVFESNISSASITLDKGLYIVKRLSKTYKVLVQ